MFVQGVARRDGAAWERAYSHLLRRRRRSSSTFMVTGSKSTSPVSSSRAGDDSLRSRTHRPRDDFLRRSDGGALRPDVDDTAAEGSAGRDAETPLEGHSGVLVCSTAFACLFFLAVDARRQMASGPRPSLFAICPSFRASVSSDT